MQAWPLTGRAEELQVIADMLRGDEYVGVVIAGRPGVGKTRLAREAVTTAEKLGFAVRWVVGTVAAQSVPLGAFAQWTEGIEADPLQLVRTVIAAIVAAPPDTIVLVVVDDAHLLDDVSAFVLHQLVLRRAATVIATLRTGYPAPEVLTGLWKDGRLQRLDLQPLSRLQSESLLAEVLVGQVSPECCDEMWRLAAGNVLFLSQLVKQELESGRLVRIGGRWLWAGPTVVSQSLMEVVELYVGSVVEPVLDVIDLVAVAEPLELAYLSALADPAAILETERRGLITVVPTSGAVTVRVGHPLFGEVRRAQPTRLRLTHLRGRIVAVMTSLTPSLGPPDPIRLALLWLDSDLPADAEVLHRAARAAFARLDLTLAHRLAEAAVRAGAGVDAQLLNAFTLSILGRGAEAEQALVPLAALGPADAAWATAVTVRAGTLLWPLRRPAESWEFIDQAQAAATGAAFQAPLAFRVMQLASAGRPAEALAAFETVDCGALPALPALVSTWGAVLALGDLGNPLRAAALAVEGTVLAVASPDAGYLAILLVIYHVQALTLGGYIDQALAVADHTYQLCVDVPGQTRATGTAVKGVAALANGDLPTALKCLGAAVAEFDAIRLTTGIDYGFGVAYTAAVALSGDVDSAVAALADLGRTRHPAQAYLESDELLAAAYVTATRGHLFEARTLVRQAGACARAHGQHAREVVCLQTAIRFGDNGHVERLADLAQIVQGPRATVVARWATALTADDGDGLLDVSQHLETIGDRIAAADAAAQAALAFHRQGRRGSALTAGGRAERLIAACGAVTPATRSVATPLPLSRREREIAAMVTDGLSNKQIAEALTLSVRTVENHIYRACSNLGVNTRAELASLLSEFPGALQRMRPPGGNDLRHR